MREGTPSFPSVGASKRRMAWMMVADEMGPKMKAGKI